MTFPKRWRPRGPMLKCRHCVNRMDVWPSVFKLTGQILMHVTEADQFIKAVILNSKPSWLIICGNDTDHRFR